MLDFEVGIEIIDTAMDSVQEERIFQRWVHGYQYMEYEDFVRHVGEPRKHKDYYSGEETAEEILDKVKGILNGNI